MESELIRGSSSKNAAVPAFVSSKVGLVIVFKHLYQVKMPGTQMSHLHASIQLNSTTPR